MKRYLPWTHDLPPHGGAIVPSAGCDRTPMQNYSQPQHKREALQLYRQWRRWCRLNDPTLTWMLDSQMQKDGAPHRYRSSGGGDSTVCEEYEINHRSERCCSGGCV
jgi:hypothetical protein